MRRAFLGVIAGLTLLCSGCTTQKINNDFYDKVIVPFDKACLIKYELPKFKNSRQSLTQTVKSQTGDCKATAKYLQELWYKQGVKSEFVVGRLKEGAKDRHMWNKVEWDNVIYHFDAVGRRFFREREAPKGMYIEEEVDLEKEYGWGDWIGKNRGNFVSGVNVK